MQRGAANETVTIVYPPQCREVTQDLGADELIRRLKTLAHTFQSMGQDDGTFQEYIPLSLHLSDNYFLTHPSKDVQLLIACCIADVLRVYAPEAPYKDPDKVKRIFMFLIRQLSGLRDPKDPAFKRYFYLLENLAYVKSFNMCFELEDSQEIFCSLFSLMFRIVNDEHSQKVRSFMLDVMCPLITESDVLSTQLLDIILNNLVGPNKKTKKQAYKLAEELVRKTADTLEPYIQNFFNQVLILGNEDKKMNIAKKVYDLIEELNKICPNVLLAVLPQLEYKLKSTESSERLGVVTLLAGMFSEEGSTLALQHRNLWTAFLGRFNDINLQIRTTCVQHSMHFLLNHPELREEIVETLEMRQHDTEEVVRLEVVKAIVSTAKKNFSIVSDSEALLNFVKERTLDKKFKIRREAMTGLAYIYKEHQSDPNVPEATKNAVTWIKDKILHGYYMPGLDDRLLVERLMNMYLVPYKLPPEERMKKLYYLFATIDENATKAFIELQKHQMSVRKCVTELLETYSKQLPIEERDKELVARVTYLSKYLPESIKSLEFLKKLALRLASDSSVLKLMKTVVDPKISCKECTEAVNDVLKKSGPPVKTNLYYSTVKMLLERVSSVMVDEDALSVLLQYVSSCVKGDSNMAHDIGIDPASAGEKGLRLLYVLSFVFPSHFLHDHILSTLISLLQLPEDSVQPLVLSIFTFVGKHRPIGDVLAHVMDILVPLCKRFAESGTPKQAKHAIRCLYSNMVKEVEQDKLYPLILDHLKESLSLDNRNYRTTLVSLGHLAYHHPDKFPFQIKNIISRKVVKELLMKDHTTTTISDSEDWVEEDELPEETRCKMEGMKLMARWLLGLKHDNISAQKTFRMLSAFILHKGDLLEESKVSRAEKAWLRLCAGCCMLKICEQKGVGDQFTAEQFYTLSLLMVDESGHVRERFAAKLHKGLNRGIPHRCLPLDFMGLYAFGGHETDRVRRSMIRNYMISDISKRREYIKGLLLPGPSEKAIEQLPHILPDYMLVFAVPVLAHDPNFSSYEDADYLTKIRSCLWFILEPLITKNPDYCFGFYKELVEKMKHHKDAVHPDDDTMNYKIWAVCDLAMGLILQKTVTFDMKDSQTSARIPHMYFRKVDDLDFINSRSYLPSHLQYTLPKKSSLLLAGAKPNARLKPNQEDGENIESAPTRVPKEETDDDDDDEPSRKRARMNDGEEVGSPMFLRVKDEDANGEAASAQYIVLAQSS